MKQNLSQKVIGFIFKYIWIFCAALILMEVSSTIFSANTLMHQATAGVIQSVGGEISGRVDGVVRLLNGFTADEFLSDTSVPVFDRAIKTEAYRKAYNLYMIAFTDENINVSSSDETAPPKEPFSLAHRDYMQRLYSTGKMQITDAFLAGADGVTMNYTITVPIIKDEKVAGGVFGSIYFDDIQAIIQRSSDERERAFSLLGRENSIMCSSDSTLPFGADADKYISETTFFNTSPDELQRQWEAGTPTSYWEWGVDGLCYVTTMPVEPTEWTLMYQVRFSAVLALLLPAMVVKVFFYILLCFAIFMFGRRYLRRQLSEVSHLMERMTDMQRELFHSESQGGYDTILELTEKGLTDQLTGLSTRTVLFGKIDQFVPGDGTACAVLFIDLDDLKRINDTFGHEAGDYALVHFAEVLKRYEKDYNGLAARYGGDEFILILKDNKTETITEVSEKLCVALRSVIKINDNEIPIHGSIGISVYPDHSDRPEELICKADLALYMAKQSGKNRIAFYED